MLMVRQNLKVVIISDGTICTGEWQNGLPNGQGTMTYADGTKASGKWKDGKPAA